MKKIQILLLAAALLCGCGSGAVTAPTETAPLCIWPSGGDLPLETPTLPDGSANTTGHVTLLTNNIRPDETTVDGRVDGASLRDFALALLPLAEGENPVLSPLSAYLALGMAAGGAAGATAEEFAALLGGDTAAVNALAKAMDEALAADEVNTFRTANSAWVDGDSAILEDYLSELVTWYGAEVYAAELESEEAKDAMNEWVKEKTEGLIPSLFDEPLDEDAMLVLINTLYMKAEWQSKFTKESTYKDAFHAADGEKRADFMHMTANLLYLSGEGYEGVALPYAEDGLRFVALKPTEGTARELLASLDGEALAALAASEERARVALSLPKFEPDYAMTMNDALKALGLAAAFEPETADFSAMGASAEGDPLYISSVLQKVKIIVDEEGTEAAAATAVTMATTSAAEAPPLELRFDEPFVYFIVDTTYAVPLFAGILDAPV